MSAQPLRLTAKDRSRMSDKFRHPLNVLVLGLTLFATGAGQARESQSSTAAAAVDVARVGPQVGTTLPDFTLRDQRGEPHSLTSLLGPKGALIVFFRSADW
jgi:cytochrome oxidase Cu insertion factor (SCO1/SenC/PrrC family)